MLIEAEKIQRKASGRTPADIEGIIVAINDVYDRFPEKFGNESKRTRLKNDIRQFLSEPRVPEDFFSFFAKAMENVGIANPFASLSLAFVGGYDSHDKYGNRVKPGHDAPVRCTYDAAMPVISMFGRFHDIAVHKTGLLETENSLAVIGGNVADRVGGFYLASSLGYSKQVTGSYQAGFMIFAALTIAALIGLTAVKQRWRTTWGATHLTAAKI